jgi:hypothetical protein
MSSFYAVWLDLIVMQVPNCNVLRKFKNWLYHNSAEILIVLYSSNYIGMNVCNIIKPRHTADYIKQFLGISIA